MVKKRVPEWLNSSMWSTPPPTSDTLRFSAAPYVPEPLSSPPLPVVVSPPDPPPPPSPHPQRTHDSRANHNEATTSSSSSPSPEDISRQTQFLTELSRKVVDVRELRRIAIEGIPDALGIRPVVWKLLLGYLPTDRALWPSELAKKRSQYKHFKENHLVNPLVRNHEEDIQL